MYFTVFKNTESRKVLSVADFLFVNQILYKSLFLVLDFSKRDSYWENKSRVVLKTSLIFSKVLKTQVRSVLLKFMLILFGFLRETWNEKTFS